MNIIGELTKGKKQIKVQTGVRWSELDDFLKNYGLSVRTHPSSFFSTVGGWLATGGYGIGSFQFGYLKEANTLMEEDLFRVCDAVLATFEEDEEEIKFLTFSGDRRILADDYLSHYLWHERLFPMKKRNHKPTPLASELIIPLENAVPLLEKINGLSKRYRINLQLESHIVERDKALLMVTYNCDVRASLHYLLHMSLIPALTRLGIAYGGIPYGVGIWNTPFVQERYDKNTLSIYKAYKKEVDPRTIFNPNKFFSLRTKLANIPGILLTPPIYRLFIRGVTPGTSFLAHHSHKQEEKRVLMRCGLICPRL